MMARARGAKGLGGTNAAKQGPRSQTPPKGRKSPPSPLAWSEATVAMTPGGGWHFVMPIPERTNAIWRQWKGRTLVSAKHRGDKISAPAIFAAARPLMGDVRCDVLWIRARRSGDVDGRLKSTLDLLRGIAYADDAQVASVQITRVDDSAERPRVEVIVTPCDAPTIREWKQAA